MQFQSSGSSNLSVDKIYSINAIMILKLLFKLQDQLPKVKFVSEQNRYYLTTS